MNVVTYYEVVFYLKHNRMFARENLRDAFRLTDEQAIDIILALQWCHCIQRIENTDMYIVSNIL